MGCRASDQELRPRMGKQIIVNTRCDGYCDGLEDKVERIYKTLSNLDVKCTVRYHAENETKVKNVYALVEFWTDTAGQDIPTEFEYDGTPEDFVAKFTEAAESYDVDEEVRIYSESLGKRGVPSTMTELFADCQEAKNTLMQIEKALKRAINPVKVFSVPFAYEMYGRIEVEADSEAEAIKKAESELDNMTTADINAVSNYLEDSLEVDEDGRILEVV